MSGPVWVYTKRDPCGHACRGISSPSNSPAGDRTILTPGTSCLQPARKRCPAFHLLLRAGSVDAQPDHASVPRHLRPHHEPDAGAHQSSHFGENTTGSLVCQLYRENAILLAAAPSQPEGTYLTQVWAPRASALEHSSMRSSSLTISSGRGSGRCSSRIQCTFSLIRSFMFFAPDRIQLS